MRNNVSRKILYDSEHKTIEIGQAIPDFWDISKKYATNVRTGLIKN